jgi:hypothetical protein
VFFFDGYSATVLHLLQEPPAAVIVDDLAHLLANTRWAGLVLLGIEIWVFQSLVLQGLAVATGQQVPQHMT